jgi:hypothetical protein
MGTDQQEWIDDSVLCWIDYETTGIDLQDPGVVPIEIGFMLTDMELTPLNLEWSGFSSLIDWGFKDIVVWDEYSPSALSAFPYHKLPPAQVVSDGLQPSAVAARMVELVKGATPEGARCILISDNIQFEWQLTKKLLAEHPTDPKVWPFHYCGWDTSVLQLVPDLGFVDPPDPPHRALPDTMGLWRAVQHAVKGTPKLGVDRSVYVGLPCGEA